MKLHQHISLILLILLTLTLGAGFVASVSLSAGESSEIVNTTYAQETYKFLAPVAGFDDEIDVSSEDSFPQYVQTLITIAIGIAIMAAIVMIVMAGFSYMTSTSQSGTSEAKKNIQNAVLGLILALASVVILQTINPNLVELNSVQTVTTSGEALDDDISPDVDDGTEYGGTVHYPDERSHGDKYCMWIEAEWTGWDFIGMGTEDRYICYQSQEACEENKEDAKEAGQDAGWFTELSCDFYYQSYGELVFDDTGEVLEDDIKGISTESKEAAVTDCEQRVENVATEKNISEEYIYEQCIGENNMSGQGFDSSKCTIQCGEADNPPAEIPESWDGVAYCSEEDPSASDSNCWNERSACRSAGNQCYMHPTQMYGRDTSCVDCLFIDDLANTIIAEEGGEADFQQQFKYENMCSGNDAAHCRLNDKLMSKLYSMYKTDLEFEITEVFPPTVEHQDDCHYDATCADVGINASLRDGDNYTAKANYLVNFIKEAKTAELLGQGGEDGLKACYEVASAEEEQQIVAKAKEIGLTVDGAEIGDIYKYIQVVPEINANHFSVYEGESGFCDYEGAVGGGN